MLVDVKSASSKSSCLSQAVPLGHEPIHRCEEPGMVGQLQQMSQLVDNDVFEAIQVASWPALS